MFGDQSHRTRPPGWTTGTSERPAQHLAGQVLSFDLGEELERLRGEDAWQREDHNAITLVKESDFRVVLVALKAGGRLPEHQTHGRITIQTISGHLRLHLPEQVVDLLAGHLVSLDRQVAHDVEAVEESACLLTLAWPEERATAG